MAEYTISAHVDLHALRGKLQRSIQHSIDLVSFGLLSAEKATDGELTLPGAYFQVAIGGNEAWDFETAKCEFQRWIVTAGLRDCVEALGGTLEEVRQVCVLWSFAGQELLRGEQWNKEIVDGTPRFHRLGLPDKIDYLNRYDTALAPEVTDCVLSINASRNCLVHRQGIVSDRDMNSENGLLVEWVKMELLVDSPEGERLLVPPARVEAGETIMVRQSRTKKLFPKSEVVRFSAQEFSELCWTLFVFVQQLTANLEKFGRAKGIAFREPDASK